MRNKTELNTPVYRSLSNNGSEKMTVKIKLLTKESKDERHFLKCTPLHSPSIMSIKINSKKNTVE